MKGGLITVIGLMSIMLLSKFSVALAAVVQTKITITNGSATVKQTTDDQTIEIEVNESANIETNVTDSGLTYKIDARGAGKVETNIDGESFEIDAEVDNKVERHVGTGVFRAIYKFFKKFVFFGWVKL